MDCFEFIKNIPDNCVDLILTDPPYNISQYSSGNIYLPGRKPLNNDIADWDKVEIDPKDLVSDFKRILKANGNIFVFTGYNTLGKWHEAFDNEFDSFNFFVWHKTDPTPKIYKTGFVNSCELIICMWNKGHTWNFKEQSTMHNFFNCPVCRFPERLKKDDGTKLHSTQKPEDLLRRVITIFSKVGDLVFDPFGGTMTTAAVAKKAGRQYLTIEREKGRKADRLNGFDVWCVKRDGKLVGIDRVREEFRTQKL